VKRLTFLVKRKNGKWIKSRGFDLVRKGTQFAKIDKPNVVYTATSDPYYDKDMILTVNILDSVGILIS